jgi:Response regulators consisting of a CheY-like receiver domain and a winged-helix DNA-binding domain
MKKILIIEDDSEIAAIERDYLNLHECVVTICSDGLSGLNRALAEPFDVILLDLMLPGMNGLAICQKLREKLDIPILMVTAKCEDIDKVRGLGIGADDYIVKPFSPNELVARVKANISQYERLKSKSETVNEMSVGSIIINLKSHRVFVNEQEIELKNREYELLLYLVMNADTVLSKETLYERIWGYDALGDNATVAVHINRLREKIEKDPTDPKYIQTVWGAGYRFNSIKC